MFFVKTFFYKLLMVGLKCAVKIISPPQPLIFVGKHSSIELAELMISQDYKHVLLVTDRVINQLGIADVVCQLFENNKIKVTIFDDITPDPSEHIIEKGINIAKSAQCDAVLGIGGGSSLDAAKMIAVLATTNKLVKQVVGLLKIQRRGLPLFLLPTTSGTGSEVTMAAVISDSQNQSKLLVISPKMMPLATALDAVLMQGMPAKITADTGFDALTHAIEAFLSTHATEQTDYYAITAVKLIFNQLPIAFRQGKNLEARQAIALASCYAGMAFTKAGLGYVHAISHQLGAKYHLPHGMTNAVVLPHVLLFNAKNSSHRLAVLAKKLALDNNQRDDAKLADLFIEAIKTLQQELGIQTTLDCIQASDIELLAKAALKEAHYLYPVPKYLNLPQCKNLIRQLMPAAA